MGNFFWLCNQFLQMYLYLWKQSFKPFGLEFLMAAVEWYLIARRCAVNLWAKLLKGPLHNHIVCECKCKTLSSLFFLTSKHVVDIDCDLRHLLHFNIQHLGAVKFVFYSESVSWQSRLTSILEVEAYYPSLLTSALICYFSSCYYNTCSSLATIVAPSIK